MQFRRRSGLQLRCNDVGDASDGTQRHRCFTTSPPLSAQEEDGRKEGGGGAANETGEAVIGWKSCGILFGADSWGILGGIGHVSLSKSMGNEY